MTPVNFEFFESDDVLESFMIENPNPSAMALETWMRRFPDHAQELSRFASILRHRAKIPSQRDNEFDAIIASFYGKVGYEPTDEQWAQCALEHQEFSTDILDYAEAARIAGPYKPGETVELTPEQERDAERRADAILDEFHRLERLEARVDPSVLQSPRRPR